MQFTSNMNIPGIPDLIPEALDQKLIQIATRQTYSDGQIIHSRGDIKPGLSIVRAGAAHVGTFGKDGSFISISLLNSGQTFGEFTLFADLPRTQDITAVGSTQIDQIPGTAFMALYETERILSHALMVIALRRSHILIENLTDGRRLGVDVLLAKILLEQSIPTKNMHSASIHMVSTRHSDLAATLGLSRYTVGKTLKTLSEIGLITLGYKQILIQDPKRLTAWIEHRNTVETLSASTP